MIFWKSNISNKCSKYFDIRFMIRSIIDFTFSFSKISLIMTTIFNDSKFVFNVLRIASIWLIIMKKHCIFCFLLLKSTSRQKSRFNYDYIYRIVRIQIRKWKNFWLLFFNFSFSIALNFQHSLCAWKRFHAKKCFCNNNDIDIRIVLLENDQFIATTVFRIKFVLWIRFVWIIVHNQKWEIDFKTKYNCVSRFHRDNLLNIDFFS